MSRLQINVWIEKELKLARMLLSELSCVFIKLCSILHKQIGNFGLQWLFRRGIHQNGMKFFQYNSTWVHRFPVMGHSLHANLSIFHSYIWMVDFCLEICVRWFVRILFYKNTWDVKSSAFIWRAFRSVHNHCPMCLILSLDCNSWNWFTLQITKFFI